MNFEKLEVYNKAVEFSLIIYKLTDRWAKSDLFGLTSQIQRSALSISLNIAEGSSRSKKDFAHFLTIARGSCYECIPLLTVAFKRDLIDKAIYTRLRDEIEVITKMINGLRNSLTTNHEQRTMN